VQRGEVEEFHALRGGVERTGLGTAREFSEDRAPYPRKVPTRLLALIHPSAWNRNSANFALTEFSEDEMRRPTPRSTLWVCKHYTGSNAQEGGSARSEW